MIATSEKFPSLTLVLAISRKSKFFARLLQVLATANADLPPGEFPRPPPLFQRTALLMTASPSTVTLQLSPTAALSLLLLLARPRALQEIGVDQACQEFFVHIHLFVTAFSYFMATVSSVLRSNETICSNAFHEEFVPQPYMRIRQQTYILGQTLPMFFAYTRCIFRVAT